MTQALTQLYPNRIFGARSTSNLRGVHPHLIEVVTAALHICDVDFTVIEGVRTYARQLELYGQGRTAGEMKAQGLSVKLAQPKLPRVTWTLTSNHFVQKSTGYGHAVDLAHIRGGRVIWEDDHKIAHAMLRAAEALNIPIRWGKDWNRNGKPGEKGETDGPHFELWGAQRV